VAGLSVLHVAQPLASGVTNVVANLAEDQKRRGWAVAVACPVDSDTRGYVEALHLPHIEWRAGRSPGPSIARETAALARIVAQVGPDLVHLHSTKAGLAGRLAIRRRLATVFQPHAWSFEAVDGALRRATIAWERAAARWADALVCVSDDERLRGEHVGVRGHFVHVPNGVDLDRFAPASAEERERARRELGLEARPTALLLGRLSRQKGQDVMLRAWPRVRARVPDAELLLIGDGPDRRALEQLATEGVRFCGAIRSVPPWLAAADVLVVPSRWEAGLTIAAMEAMARARSVVATDVAGMREGLEPDCGCVVAVEAEEALASAVAERLENPSLAAREGLAGRRRVEERHDLRATSETMAELYGKVLERRR
jgi:glycosyltransferase involved in cell wall biosynthesis